MKMLDLFCCEGIGALGYWQSGLFDEIVGVDIKDMSSSYSFDFVQADVLTLDYDFLYQFDFIHASPPCQFYSKRTPVNLKTNHPRLIPATHLMLHAIGRPYVIENVEGSGGDLKPTCILSGWDFGLPSTRRRLFHISTGAMPVTPGSSISSSTISINGGQFVRKDKMIEAMGITGYTKDPYKFTRYGIEQGIPPAMTKAIAKAVFS